MIMGVGTDSIELERVARAVESPGFLRKYFTERELFLFEQKGNQYQTIAGNFAGKEAVAKALGTGFRGFGPIAVEILRDDLGKPVVHLHDSAKELAARMGIQIIHLSITHNKKYAAAFAVAEGELSQ